MTDDQPPNPPVRLYDTTLRDGTQAEGVSFSMTDKVRIARRLNAFGVAYIEGGWPGSNPTDMAFFEEMRGEPLSHAKIAAFGSTRRAQFTPEDDPNLRTLLQAETPVTTIFGKTWLLHVHDVLRVAPEVNLDMISSSCQFLRDNGKEVIFDAEHFFDGYFADADYALAVLRAAIAGGAATVVLCDTNGGTLPYRIEDVCRTVRAALPEGVVLGIHCHDDTGCAVASSLSAVHLGCAHVQGTVNGLGERCGNANLCAIMPSLELKMATRCLPEGSLCHLSELSQVLCCFGDFLSDSGY